MLDNFANVGKIVKTGIATKEIEDYRLSRYACYLIVQNGDPRKEVIALGQTYFALQTRKQEILDNMGEDELIANLFRISQTKQKLVNDEVFGEQEANDTHYEVGKKVRKAIADIGGKMPEELPTPKKSLKEIEKVKKLNNGYKSDS